MEENTPQFQAADPHTLVVRSSPARSWQLRIGGAPSFYDVVPAWLWQLLRRRPCRLIRCHLHCRICWKTRCLLGRGCQVLCRDGSALYRWMSIVIRRAEIKWANLALMPASRCLRVLLPSGLTSGLQIVFVNP